MLESEPSENLSTMLSFDIRSAQGGRSRPQIAGWCPLKSTSNLVWKRCEMWSCYLSELSAYTTTDSKATNIAAISSLYMILLGLRTLRLSHHGPRCGVPSDISGPRTRQQQQVHMFRRAAFYSQGPTLYSDGDSSSGISRCLLFSALN
jgi:hypothetical protein